MYVRFIIWLSFYCIDLIQWLFSIYFFLRSVITDHNILYCMLHPVCLFSFLLFPMHKLPLYIVRFNWFMSHKASSSSDRYSYWVVTCISAFKFSCFDSWGRSCINVGKCIKWTILVCDNCVILCSRVHRLRADMCASAPFHCEPLFTSPVCRAGDSSLMVPIWVQWV